MSAEGMFILPGQGQEQDVTIDSRPLSELVKDATSVQAALEWGLQVSSPAIEKMRYSLFLNAPNETGSLLLLNGFDREVGNHTLVIRQADNTLTGALLATCRDVRDSAEHNYQARKSYQNNVSGINQGYNDERRRNRRSKTVYSLGGAALLGGVPLLNNAINVVAFQADPLIALAGAGVAVLGGVASGIRRALRLNSSEQSELLNISNPEMPGGAEKLFETLLPTFEEAAKQYSADDHMKNDIVLLANSYTMNFKNVRTMLDKSGGPEYDDYKAVLKDLQANAPRYSRKPATEYIYMPTRIISDMLMKSQGALWSEEFAENLRKIEDAQRAIEERKNVLTRLSLTVKQAPGIDGESGKSHYKKDIVHLEDVIELSMLRLFKLNASYVESQTMLLAGHVTSPYSESEPETVSKSSEPSGIVPAAVGGTTWPLLQNGLPESK